MREAQYWRGAEDARLKIGAKEKTRASLCRATRGGGSEGAVTPRKGRGNQLAEVWIRGRLQ